MRRGKYRAVRQQDRRERRHGAGEESEAAHPVRVRGHQAESALAYVPEEPDPHEQPEVPAQQDELGQGIGHVHEPPAGRGQLSAGRGQPLIRGGQGVPGGDIQGDVAGPEEEAEAEHEDDDHHFRRHRVPQAKGGGDGRIESRPRARRDQIALEKLPDHGAHPLVHHQLGHDEQGQRQQKLYVHLDVEQEGHADRIAPGATAQHRQHQQGQPGDEREEHDPATHELQGIPGQVGPPHDLVQRPAQDHREVFAVLAEAGCVHHSQGHLGLGLRSVRARIGRNTNRVKGLSFMCCKFGPIDHETKVRLPETQLLSDSAVVCERQVRQGELSWAPDS